MLLQSDSRPEAWHAWFADQKLYTQHSYHGPRFDTFEMLLRAARVGCGVALVPRVLAAEELDQGLLVQAWPHALASRDAYYLAYPEHKGEVAKVRGFLDWMREHRDRPTLGPVQESAPTER